MRVLVAGHLCLDLVPVLPTTPDLAEGALHLVGELQPRCGGSVHTTGSVLSRLGVDTTLAAVVGDDTWGRVTLELLQAEGWDVGQFRRLPTSSSYTLALQPPGRDRTLWHHIGANARFDGADLDVDGMDVVHVGYPSLLPLLAADDGAALVALFGRARRAGVTTSLDLAVVDGAGPADHQRWDRFLQRVLPLTDVITPSRDDLSSALGWSVAGLDEVVAAAARLVSYGAGIALVTAGRDGMGLATGAESRLAELGSLSRSITTADANLRSIVPAEPPAAVVSTLGAGDVASAAFLASLLQGVDPEGAAHDAATIAARHVAGEEVRPSRTRSNHRQEVLR